MLATSCSALRRGQRDREVNGARHTRLELHVRLRLPDLDAVRDPYCNRGGRYGQGQYISAGLQRRHAHRRGGTHHAAVLVQQRGAGVVDVAEEAGGAAVADLGAVGLLRALDVAPRLELETDVGEDAIEARAARDGAEARGSGSSCGRCTRRRCRRRARSRSPSWNENSRDPPAEVVARKPLTVRWMMPPSSGSIQPAWSTI